LLNVLRLAQVSRADVAALAAREVEGYQVLWFAGPIPEDLVAAYARVQDAMNDAPHDDLTIEAAVTSPDRIRQWEAGVARRGWTVWTAVARDVASGELAAFNQVILRTEWPQVVENSDTGVAAAHRGRGLGLLVKATNLLRVLDLPDAVAVETWNAASNEHMLRVNRRLGFVPERSWESWELVVPGSEAEPA
jgi:GNAT superfamily N-acetyltransferase